MHLPTRPVPARSRAGRSVRPSRFTTLVHRWCVCPSVLRLRPTGDRGQTTAEYGLVILAAGTLALAAILWARSSGSITGLFQSVIDQLTGNVEG